MEHHQLHYALATWRPMSFTKAAEETLRARPGSGADHAEMGLAYDEGMEVVAALVGRRHHLYINASSR